MGTRASVTPSLARLAHAVGGEAMSPAPTMLLGSIDDVLAEYGEAMRACRAYLFVTPDGGRTVDNTHEWCRAGVAPEIDGLQRLPVAEMGSLWARLLGRHVVEIESVRDLPPGWEGEQAILEPQGIEALLLAPVVTADGVIGFVGLDFTTCPRAFGADEVATLRVLAETIGRVIERTSGEVALEQVRRDLRGAFDAAPIGMALLDHRGRILRANDALAMLVERDADELHGVHATALLHPADAIQHADAFRQLRRGVGRQMRLDVSLWTPGGSVDVAITAGSYGGIDDACRVVLHIEDVRERRAFEAELAHTRLHDPVTALPNRKLVVDRIGAAMQADVGSGRIGVLCLDLDRFRAVNDRLGHAVGDQVLAAVGARLATVVPDGATVARLGADEFMVVVPALGDDAEAMALAEVLRAAIAEPLALPATTVHLSATVGIATTTQAAHEPADELLQRADMALHTAREAGVHVQLLDRHGVLARAHRLELENQLSSALRNQELAIAYQPVHDVVDSRVVGVEALLRWPGGVAPVGQLIEIAEQSSLILDVGRFALEEAVAALPTLSEAAQTDLVLSVNLSARQLHHDTVVDGIVRALDTHGVAADRLCVEVTETMAMVDTARTVDVLGRLRALGVRVAIDDFGTGYSSLSYLRDLPADEVKIDRSFLAGAPEDPATVQMISGMVRLCRGLGLEVVGEGVESQAQLAVLAEAGCTRWQGFLSTPALPMELLAAWFASNRTTELAAAPEAFDARVRAQGYEDVLVFHRIRAGRYAHVGGIGRGEGWAGIIEIELEAHDELARALAEDDVVLLVDEDARHVIGPYHARSAAVAVVDDALVVFGHQHELATAPDRAALRCLAAEAAEAITTVAAAKPLADELEILEAVQRLLQFDGTGVVEAVRHLASTAAAVLSCEIALAWTPRSGLVAVGVESDLGPDVAAAMMELSLPDARCSQDAGPQDLPAGLVERLGIRSWYGLPVGSDGGRLVVAHTDAQPRGFTALCQRLGHTLVETSELLLRSAATRQRLHDEVDRAAAEARRDALTGVPNRLAWDEALAGVDASVSVGVFIIDVDHLKDVNDRFGHAVGDQLLRAVADVLLEAVAPVDHLARIGGDEFAILLTGERRDACADLHDVIRERVAHVQLPQVDRVSVSIGWSTGVGVAEVADATRRADQRMYRDKARRRPTAPVA